VKLLRVTLLAVDGRPVRLHLARYTGASERIRRLARRAAKLGLPRIDPERASAEEVDVPRPEAERLLQHGWDACYGGK